jgi:hypothetical protein
MHPSVIVSDLETVPDLAGFAAANDLVGKPDADIRAELGNKFPKHIYHAIVCIGSECSLAHALRLNRAPHFNERLKLQNHAGTW